MPQDRYKSLFEKYDDILTVSELAEYLRVCPKTAYDLVKTRRIKSRKIGAEWRISRQNVVDFLEH